MTDYRRTAEETEWHAERSGLIYDGAGKQACDEGRMTFELADQLAMDELREKQLAAKPKKQRGMFS